MKDILVVELDKANNLSSSTLEAIEELNDKDFIDLIKQKICKTKQSKQSTKNGYNQHLKN